MTFRTATCTRLDGPASLELLSVPRAPLGADEVRVAVRAAGVNFPDLLMTRGAYQLRPSLPFVPGMEAAGVVVETRSASVLVGARVIARLRFGAFAEEVVVPASSVVPLPDGVDFDAGACLLVASQTAHHALLGRGALARGERVLVLGATGGVGLAAVRIARLAGAEVIAVGSSEEKLAVATAEGATLAICLDGTDLVERVRALTGGVDVVYDPVGGDLARQAVRLLDWGGRYLIVGFASGEITSFAANHALLKGYSIIGVRAGEAGRRDPAGLARSIHDIMTWAAAGELRPHISHRFPLDRAADALTVLESRQVVGRVVIEM